MRKGRLEAFSDGIVAILITIMVLELKVPHGTGIADLPGLLPLFLTYVLSFVFLAIYWNICDGLDGRKSFCFGAHCGLWSRAAFRSNCILCPAKPHQVGRRVRFADLPRS